MHSMYVHTYHLVDTESRYNSLLDNAWLENYWYCKLFIRIPNTSNIKVLFNVDWTLQRDSRFHRYTPWIPEYLSFLYTTRHYTPDNHTRLAHFPYLTANIACHTKCSFNLQQCNVNPPSCHFERHRRLSRREIFSLCMVLAGFYVDIFWEVSTVGIRRVHRNVYFENKASSEFALHQNFPAEVITRKDPTYGGFIRINSLSFSISDWHGQV